MRKQIRMVKAARSGERERGKFSKILRERPFIFATENKCNQNLCYRRKKQSQLNKANNLRMVAVKLVNVPGS